MQIQRDDLHSPAIKAFLQAHLDDMHATSPPESVHALDLDGLRQSNIQFWTLTDGTGAILACGALKQLDNEHAEIKSMRTDANARGQGIASIMLSFILEQAELQGIKRVSLETGSMAFFYPAHALYRKFGFAECEPFANYRHDPHSICMTKVL